MDASILSEVVTSHSAVIQALETEKATIAVVGTGYVGLPAALLLAKHGHKVIGVDLNENIVRAINNREMLIPEEDLHKLMQDPEVDRNLTASTSVQPADVFLIAVPTPLHERKKVADMHYVISAMESIIPFLKKGSLIVLESTVPPLTCKELLKPMIESKTNLRVPEDVMVAHCPERILPGNIFHEIVHNDRIIGGMDAASSEAAKSLYESFVHGHLYVTDDVTAELCKLMENSYRDVNIALANEMAHVAESLGVDPTEAFAMANKHPRVNYLAPGIGVGGHCIPIDPWFIKEIDPMHTRMIQTARLINDEQPVRIAAKVRQAVAKLGKDAKIVAIGAAYKANTEDLRESPAMEIVELLREDGYSVDHYDPLVPEMAYESLARVAIGADLLLVLVPHKKVLKEIDARGDTIKAAMRTPKLMVF